MAARHLNLAVFAATQAAFVPNSQLGIPDASTAVMPHHRHAGRSGEQEYNEDNMERGVSHSITNKSNRIYWINGCVPTGVPERR